jgi:nucleotide-binding universal stress UspA family protein
MATRTILIPVDRSEYSLKIIEQIEKFISPKETKLILFNVIDPVTGIGTTAPNYEVDYSLAEPLPMQPPRRMSNPIYATQVEDGLISDVKDELLPVTRKLESKGYKVSTEVVFGDPATEILRTIDEKEIDMVAMTTHAREGLKRLLLGSVAEHVLHHVSVPILVIHPTK